MYKEHSIITERYLKWVEVEVLLLNVTKKQGQVGFYSLWELRNAYIF